MRHVASTKLAFRNSDCLSRAYDSTLDNLEILLCFERQEFMMMSAPYLPLLLGSSIFRLSCMALALINVSTSASYAKDAPLLERLLNQYREYENLEVMGSVIVEEPGKKQAKHEFVMRFGSTGMRGEFAPQDIRLLKRNPGEPHISEKMLTDRGFAYTSDGINVQFSRRYVTKAPVSLRRSELFLMATPPSQPQPFDAITQTVLHSIEGVDPRGYWGGSARLRKAVDLEEIGDEEFLGVKCKKVRFRQVTLAGVSDWIPVSIEALVATEPTVQVLKILSVSGGPPGYMDDETRRTYMGTRTVESVRRFGKWLVCDKVVASGGEQRTSVLIKDVRPISEGYTGLWDFNSLTGCMVAGSAEPSTRKGSGRVPYEHSKEFMIAPHTDDELKLVRGFLDTRNAQPTKPKYSVAKIVLIAVNLVALALIVTYVRKSRRT